MNLFFISFKSHHNMTKAKNIAALDIDEENEDGFTDGAVDIGRPLMTFINQLGSRVTVTLPSVREMLLILS